MPESKRLQILIVTESLPYPLTSGGKICLFNFVDYLRKYHDFTIFCPAYSPDASETKTKLKSIWPDVQLECIDLTVPESKTTFTSFFSKGLQYVARKINPQNNQMATNDYKLDFTDSFKPYSINFISALKTISHSKVFDIIQIQFTRNLNLLSVLPDKPKKIFEQIESQFDVMKDYAKTIKLDAFYSNYLVRNSEFIENSYINAYDALFTLNENDSEYFKSKLKNAVVYTTPFGVLDKDIPKALASTFTAKKVVFSGNESHYPNLDALEWYLQDVQQNVFDKLKLKLHITGTWTNETKNRLSKICPHIKFEGFVTDYASFLKDSLMIVPIRIGGGGLRTKILYAMANGVPVISTSTGSFGIEGKNQEHFYVADSAGDFFTAMELLVTNKNKTESLIQNAAQLINDRYSQTKTSELRNKLYFEILRK